MEVDDFENAKKIHKVFSKQIKYKKKSPNPRLGFSDVPHIALKKIWRIINV
jgi:hypothetical protein